MEKDGIRKLLDKYRRGSISAGEKAFLEDWYLQYRECAQEEYGEEELLEDSAAVKAALRGTAVLPRKKRRRFLYATAAAVLVLTGIFVFYRDNLNPVERFSHETADHLSGTTIFPGGNKATLTLMNGNSSMNGGPATNEHSIASGTTIHLSSEKEGIHSDGKEFHYSDGTALNSQLPDAFNAQYALLTTPRGGQYQARLPDGTRVWLNAGSNLKYPVSFKGVNQRRVVLTGEAYFEVVPNERKPFLVSTKNQTLEVLGTRFNISSYTSEQIAKTTLLEGSLKVYADSEAIAGSAKTGGKNKDKNKHGNKGCLLVPGQQAILEGERITVAEVETDEAIAWKEGYFQFNNKDLETALAELARWYDVEVTFRSDEMRRQKLAGTISRYARISQVLEKMELTGMIHFQIKGRTIIVE